MEHRFTGFSTNHAVLTRKSKDWLDWNEGNVSEWINMSTRRLSFTRPKRLIRNCKVESTRRAIYQISFSIHIVYSSIYLCKKKFEDTKGVIRRSKSSWRQLITFPRDNVRLCSRPTSLLLGFYSDTKWNDKSFSSWSVTMPAYSFSASYPNDTNSLFFFNNMHVGVFNDNSCLEPAFHTWLALVSSLFILKSCLVENAYHFVDHCLSFVFVFFDHYIVCYSSI
jgi:hypothetical protein